MNKSEIASLLSNLVTFIQVVEGKSFSAAGRAMQLSPSAVARQIDRLESTVKVILLQRTTRGLHVTEAGREIYELARDIVGRTESLLARARTFSEIPQGLLRVSVPVMLGKMLMAPLIAQFLERYPDIHVDLDLSDHIVDLLRDRFDLAVRITDHPPGDMVARALTQITYVLVCARKYPRPLPDGPGELIRHPVFLPGDRGFGGEWRFLKQGKEYRVAIRPRLASNNSYVILDALLQGRGIGIVPFFAAQRLLDSGDLMPVLTGYTVVAPREDVAYVISPPKYLISPSARVFIDFLMRSVKQRLDEGKRELLSIPVRGPTGAS